MNDTRPSKISLRSTTHVNRIAIFALLILAFLAPPSFPAMAFDSKEIDGIVRQTQSGVPGMRLSVAVRDFSDDKSYFYNAEEIFNSASSAKWLWAAAALRRQDVHSLEALAVGTFRLSDNENAGALIEAAGGIDAVNAYAREIGIHPDAWSLCSWNYGHDRIATGCSSKAEGRNFFTARAALQFLEKMHSGDLGLPMNKQSALARWALLSPRSGFGGWIGTLLNQDVKEKLMHKAGWIPVPYGKNTLNEIAIVKSKTDSYAIVILMEGGEIFNEQTLSLERMSKHIHDALGGTEEFKPSSRHFEPQLDFAHQ